MHRDGTELILSATDLSNFLACHHRTGLDLARLDGLRTYPRYDDPIVEILQQRGLEHEQRFVASLRAKGLGVVDLRDVRERVAKLAATMAAMRDGVDVIVQGGLADGEWFGIPDVLLRVPRESALGSWSYEVVDTKLARETRAGTIVQLGLYSAMLGLAQGVEPERFHVVTPGDDFEYRVHDYAAYIRLIRSQMRSTIALGHVRIMDENYPEPVEHCVVCPWDPICRGKRHADDHLSLVAGISRTQRRELESRAVKTVSLLAALSMPLQFRPKRGSVESYVRVREQARLQVESRDRTPPVHELLLPVGEKKGLCRLPEPSPGDLFLDLEGDPLAVEGGREFLFGVAAVDGGYNAEWAFTEHEERRAFERAIDRIVEAAREHPGMHVYHYAPYEPSAFKRLMGRYATRERELDGMLREGRFVDLYAVVRQALRAGVERYSIKNLEALYGFTREVELREANRDLLMVAQAVALKTGDTLPADVRAIVEGYNRDDCVSALRLRDWLERLRSALVAGGTEVARPVLGEAEPSEPVDERARQVEEVRGRLLAAVPEDRAARDDEQQGRWLLAYLLDYHRREDKVGWWEYFRLCGLPEDELLDERDAVAGMEHVQCLGRKTPRSRSVIDRYRYKGQEVEIAAGDEVWLQERKRFGKVVRVDRTAQTIDVHKAASLTEHHPTAMFAFTHVDSEVIEKSLLRIGGRVASGGFARACTRALLARESPRLASGPFAPRPAEDAGDFAVRIVDDLDHTVLAIQGPPGSGKTYCGARMICELVRLGRKVGVTATSHKVIDHLLVAARTRAAAEGVPIRLGHKVGDDDEDDGDSTVGERFTDNRVAREALRSGAVDVLGGTPWMWSRGDFESSVDVLFVDEAGQMSLANAVAVSPAANSMVLLGDPQQLEQPRKGSHPDGVSISALEHILGEHQTIPDDRGIFLPVTFRLPPSICEFTSDLFYECRLESREGLARQRVTGAAGLPDQGLVLIEVDHEGNRNSSPEEIEAVADLVARLTTAGAAWVDANGRTRPLRGDNVLVVAPYNAQVNRLEERLAGTGARVGTVDKFQGQEAPVAIYSMASSSPEDAPRGMEFLYSLNRLNVATSRAQCLAIVVASPRLFEPECHSPRQMRLANGLCRFREQAVKSRG